MILTENRKKHLIKYWNKVFNADISIDGEILSNDELFDKYLDTYAKEKTFDYVENACVCIKNNAKLGLYAANDNKIVFDEIGVNTRKKFRKYINRFDYVIVNFELSKDLINDCLKTAPNKIFLRYEILHSLFSGSQSNYIDDTLPFSGNNPAAYLTKDFISKLSADKKMMSFVKYSSYLLNHFENGIVIDDIVVKPKINVSSYGRWYWVGKDNLQNNKKMRYNIIKKITDNGDKYISVDFISAGPSMLSRITGSKILKALVDTRIKHYNDQMYTDNLKNLLNMFIHSNDDPSKMMSYLRSKYNLAYIEKIGRFNAYNALQGLYSELNIYNTKILEKYKESLTCKELRRRIVNSESAIDDDKDILKKHRVYLQGHVHDSIIILTKHIYNKLGILPIYTVHDSVNFYIPKSADYDQVIMTFKDAAKEVKIPFRIEEF